MATNGITAQRSSPPPGPRRRGLYVSGLAVRVLLALAFAWLIVMAFFATSVISH